MSDLRITTLVAVLAVSACAPDDAGEPGETVQAYLCPPNACGNDGNSPVIDGVYFWRLNRDLLENEQGVKITSVVKANGTPMRLAAMGDRLVGLALGSNAIVAQNIGLDGTKIFVSVNGNPYRIKIEYPRVWEPFWVGPPAHDPVETYKLTYKPTTKLGDEITGAIEKPLCKVIDEWPGYAQLRALVFAGDKYDPITKTLEQEGPFDGWMTIACHASAPWKMHLMGHTTGAAMHLSDVPLTASTADRQALLNAWTMNACGKGPAFTCQGVPISLTVLAPGWSQVNDGAAYQPDAPTREAVWGPQGALCLNIHRLSTSDKDAAERRAAIAKQCGREIPPCTAAIEASSDAYVTTGVPTWPADPMNLPSCPVTE